jgi:predicted amidophosphoribosyltransferase
MFCPNCGVAISEVGSFCAKCGKNVAYLTEVESVLAEQPENAQSIESAAKEMEEENAATPEGAEKTAIEEVHVVAPRIVLPVSEKVYFCNKCGTSVYSKDNYCYQCGKKTQKQYYCVQGKKRKKIVIGLSLVILCLVVAAVCYKLTS